MLQLAFILILNRNMLPSNRFTPPRIHNHPRIPIIDRKLRIIRRQQRDQQIQSLAEEVIGPSERAFDLGDGRLPLLDGGAGPGDLVIVGVDGGGE